MVDSFLLFDSILSHFIIYAWIGPETQGGL